jgi:hypothetical protein
VEPATASTTHHRERTGGRFACSVTGESPTSRGAGPSLLIVEDVGYLPMASEAAAAIFHVISRRVGRQQLLAGPASRVAATEVSRVGASWPQP